jgi:hypothetical protein
MFNLPTSLQFRHSPTKPNPTQPRREEKKRKKKRKEKDQIKPNNNKKANIPFVFPLPF